ncbi:hypothetical protein H6G64_35400 [Calothrix sp. FACHB-156]|nr:hypothetical protein [Calothrix sp. FACHB-156]
MATLGCGCKICKAELGDYTNQLIKDGLSPIKVLEILQNKGLKTTERLLKKHLSAFSIAYPETMKKDETVHCEPVTVDLNKIDFSEYDFDVNQPDSIIAYLQKINLKIYLNQTKITLKAQEDVINGNSPDMPKEIMQNLAVAFQILDKSTGLSVHVNQQQAIKTVESMGLTVQSSSNILLPSNVPNNSKSETN